MSVTSIPQLDPQVSFTPINIINHWNLHNREQGGQGDSLNMQNSYKQNKEGSLEALSLLTKLSLVWANISVSKDQWSLPPRSHYDCMSLSLLSKAFQDRRCIGFYGTNYKVSMVVYRECSASLTSVWTPSKRWGFDRRWRSCPSMLRFKPASTLTGGEWSCSFSIFFPDSGCSFSFADLGLKELLIALQSLLSSTLRDQKKRSFICNIHLCTPLTTAAQDTVKSQKANHCDKLTRGVVGAENLTREMH